MEIEIYTLSWCPFCRKAKEFFDNQNIKYTEYEIDGNEDEIFKKLQKKYDIKGEVTVPQIIIDGERVGGYSDLIERYPDGKINF